MQDLHGKTALVTGASRGIGAATAKALALAGMRVALVARSAEPLEALAREITDAGGDAIALPCDVADFSAFADAVSTTELRLGPLDILVNNAGVIDPIGRILDVEPQDWLAAADINFKSVYNGMRCALPRMVARGTGTIINISSGAAHRGLEGWSHYCSAKAAAAMLTECAHIEYGADVRIIGLSPGTVATDMQQAIRASGINAVSKLDPTAHISPEWPARAILWLCGEDGAEFAGKEVSLRDEGIRRRIGLI